MPMVTSGFHTGIHYGRPSDNLENCLAEPYSCEPWNGIFRYSVLATRVVQPPLTFVLAGMAPSYAVPSAQKVNRIAEGSALASVSLPQVNVRCRS